MAWRSSSTRSTTNNLICCYFWRAGNVSLHMYSTSMDDRNSRSNVENRKQKQNSRALRLKTIDNISIFRIERNESWISVNGRVNSFPHLAPIHTYLFNIKISNLKKQSNLQFTFLLWWYLLSDIISLVISEISSIMTSLSRLVMSITDGMLTIFDF